MMNTQYTLFGEDFSFNVETSTMQVNNISKYQFNQDSYLCESTWCAICYMWLAALLISDTISIVCHTYHNILKYASALIGTVSKN